MTVKPLKILIVADTSYKPIKMYLDQMPKLTKGFLRLGHDVRIFSYCGALQSLTPFRSKSLTKYLYKTKVDNMLAKYAENYLPDIVYISFARVMDEETITSVRKAVPNAFFVGGDGDPWPKLQANRIQIAKELDLLIATNDGSFLQDYRDDGVSFCAFVPNVCDPDIDHRYEVGPEWKTNILWTGKTGHKACKEESFREQLVNQLDKMPNSSLYGCLGRPKIEGIKYLYAISGARIGVNANAVNTVRLYHSDRITNYLAGGTFVLAKRVPDTELLFKDGQHLRYFDEIDEFVELANWYLTHEDERKKIADAGMNWTHQQFNGTKIAGYILDLIEKGKYSAPWVDDS